MSNLFYFTSWCGNGDCDQPWCHRCYPVLNCNLHANCIENGTFEFMPVPPQNKNTSIQENPQTDY
tara:strand:+ start:843 stop:1037 length:195 start_codon:yes stop_codon:yes gene_type:complete